MEALPRGRLALSAWAETVVHGEGNSYPPRVGEACAGTNCEHVFGPGESAYRLTELKDYQWVCAKCAQLDQEPMGG